MGVLLEAPKYLQKGFEHTFLAKIVDNRETCVYSMMPHCSTKIFCRVPPTIPPQFLSHKIFIYRKVSLMVFVNACGRGRTFPSKQRIFAVISTSSKRTSSKRKGGIF